MLEKDVLFLHESVLIKMKDTSIFSFKDPESEKVRNLLRRDEKDKTISGRKMEELNRVRVCFIVDS